MQPFKLQERNIYICSGSENFSIWLKWENDPMIIFYKLHIWHHFSEQETRRPNLRTEEKNWWAVWQTETFNQMFKELQQQHAWLWPTTITALLTSSSPGSWQRSMSYIKQHTQICQTDSNRKTQPWCWLAQ
jgi:hypothetical protein